MKEIAELKRQLTNREKLRDGYKKQQRTYGGQYNRYYIYSPYYRYAYYEMNKGLSNSTITSRRNYYKKKLDLANNGVKTNNSAIKDLKHKINYLENVIDEYRDKALGEDTASTTFVPNPYKEFYNEEEISLELLNCIQSLENGEAVDLDNLTPTEKDNLEQFSIVTNEYYYSVKVTSGPISGFYRNFKELTEEERNAELDRVAILQNNYLSLANYLKDPNIIYSNEWDTGVFSGSVTVMLNYSDTSTLGKAKVDLVKFDINVGFMASGKVSLVNAQADFRLGNENYAAISKYDIDLFAVSGSASITADTKDGYGVQMGATASVLRLAGALGAEINGYEATVGGQLDLLTVGSKIHIGIIPGSDEIFKLTPPGASSETKRVCYF